MAKPVAQTVIFRLTDGRKFATWFQVLFSNVNVELSKLIEGNFTVSCFIRLYIGFEYKKCNKYFIYRTLHRKQILYWVDRKD